MTIWRRCSKRKRSSLSISLPGGVGGSVGSSELGAAVDVVDAGFGLIEGLKGVVLGSHPGVGALGERVFWKDFEVASLDEVVEGLGGLLLVDGVGVDGLAHDVEVLFEDSLLCVADVAGVGGDSDGGEQTDDDHDDHELEEGEALLGGFRASCDSVYHVEYFVPSRAVPWLLE